MRPACVILRWALTFALLFGAMAAQAAITITRTSSPVFYIDTSITPPLTGMYASYQITSTTNVADAWVRAESFTGGVVGLGPNEDGVVHLGALTAGVTKTAFFYLTATSATTSSQSHSVVVYDRNPALVGAASLASGSITISAVQETIKAASNTVTTVVSGPNPAAIGGIMTITVTGGTGTIGSAPGPNGPLAFTAASYQNWTANAYELIGSGISLSGGNSGTFYDRLYFASLPGSGTTTYQAVYTFRVTAFTFTSTTITPAAYIASGAQIKHVDPASFGVAQFPVLRPDNFLTMSKFVSAATLPNSGGQVTYTLRIFNNSSSETLSLDQIQDTLPTAPAAVTYVSGSSAFNGVAIGNPLISGNQLTWGGTFAISPGSFRDLTFRATIPAISGNYTNSATGLIGTTTIIDTTFSTTDNIPATATTVLLAAPVLSKAFAVNAIAPGGVSTLIFTLTNTNASNALTGVGFTDVFPTSPGAMTLASTGFTNTCGGALTDSAGNPIAVGSAGLKLAGASIAANSSCTISVSITASTSGDYTNASGPVSSTNGGAGNSASATLAVGAKPAITKSFSPATIALNGVSTLTLTLNNNIAGTLNIVSFTDTFPATPGAMTLASATSTNSCGGTLTDSAGAPLAIGSASVKLTGGTVAASGNCAITLLVKASTFGSYSNVSGGVSALETGAAGPVSNPAVLNVLGPPTVTKSFSPSPVAINYPSTLTITITNPNVTGTLNGISISDTFPAGLVNSPTPAAATTCTAATITGGAAGGNTIGITGAGLAAGASCTLTVNVQAAATGSYVNTTGAVSSTEGGAGGVASATLVVDREPAIVKNFVTNPIAVGTTTRLTFTITNNNLSGSLTGITFTDSFPTSPGPMTLANDPSTGTLNISNSCGGTFTASNGAALAVGSTSVKLTAGAITTAGASCTIAVFVTAATGGIYTNTTGVLGSSAGNGSASIAVLTALSPPSLSKNFNPNPILLTGTSTLTFNLVNTNPSLALIGVSFTDTFPASPAQMSLANTTTTNACGGTLTTSAGAALAVGSTSVKLNGGSIPANSTCSISVTVKLNTATAGNYVNQTANITSTNGGTGDFGTDALIATVKPSIAKSFSVSSILVNGVSRMTLVLTNNTSLGALGSVSFSDTFPSGLVVAPTPNLTNTCGGAVTGGTAGAGFLNLTGATIASGATSTCSIAVNVTSVAGGTYANTTSGVSSDQSGSAGPVSNTAVLDVNLPTPGVTKSFSPSTIVVGMASQMTIGFSNANAVAVTGAAFTDTYPAGLANVISGTVLASNTCGGLVTAANGTTSLAFIGGTIPPGGCAILVNVTATATGTLTNNTGIVTFTNAADSAGASGSLTAIAPATLAKAFSPAMVGANQPSTLTFNITNSSGNPAQTGLGFTDTFPSGMTVASAPATPQCGGTISFTTNSITLSGGSLAAGVSSCTVSVGLTSATPSTYSNTSSNISGVTGGLLTSGVSSTLTVVGTTLAKSFSPSSIGVGGTSTLTFTVANGSGNPAQSGLSFIDTLPANVTVAGVLTASQCGGVVSSSGPGNIAFSGGSLASGVASCTINAIVTSAIAGVYTNAAGNMSGLSAGMANSVNASLTVIAGVTVSGTVYNDVNHNSSLDSGETGTGQTIYAKLINNATPTVAIQAVAVDPGAGAYGFSGVPVGAYTLILDGNNTLSDVTPSAPTGWISTEGANQTRGGVTLGTANLLNQNFGLFNGSKLAGTVFKDTGSPSGTANNGIQDGAEVGITGVTVIARNSACPLGTCDSTVTDGVGNYVLWIPASVGANPVRIVEANFGGYVSTGAQVGTTAGSYDRTTDTVTFTNAVGTTYSVVNFGDVPDNSFTTDGVQIGLPGAVLFYAHTFTADSAGSVIFSTTNIATPSIVWSNVIYRDSDCNGVLAASEATTTYSGASVSAGQVICIIVKEFIPAGAPVGAQDQITVTASFSYTGASPTLSAIYLHTDTTIVGTVTSAGLTLLKSVNRASALPGDVLTYTITYANNSSGPLSNVVISDSTPAFTTYMGASAGCPLLVARTSCTVTTEPANGSTGSISWSITGTVGAGVTATVQFQVRVQN